MAAADRGKPDCVPRGGKPVAVDPAGAIYAAGGESPFRYFICLAGSEASTELMAPRLPGSSERGTIGLASLRTTHFGVSWSFLGKDSVWSRISFGDLRTPGRARTVLAVQPPSEASGESTLVQALKLSSDGRPAWIGEQLGFYSEHSDAVRQVDAVSPGGRIEVLDEGASIGSRLLAWNGRRLRWMGADGPRSAIVR
jgi:hypothetical protein